MYALLGNQYISFFLFLGFILSESDALYLPIAHYEIPKHITICKDDYKFVAYPYSILQEFAVDMR